MDNWRTESAATTLDNPSQLWMWMYWRLPRRILPAANLTAEMETKAQRRWMIHSIYPIEFPSHGIRIGFLLVFYTFLMRLRVLPERWNVGCWLFRLLSKLVEDCWIVTVREVNSDSSGTGATFNVTLSAGMGREKLQQITKLSKKQQDSVSKKHFFTLLYMN